METSDSLFNGDKVKAPEVFGESVLVFVGMAHGLDFNNDCVVLYDGKAVPIVRANLQYA